MTRRMTLTIARAKREILADIASGRVPATVKNFSELHDYVDANGYGGAFEDGAMVILDEDNEAAAHASMDFWNDVQGEVNQWLEMGRPRRIPVERPIPAARFERMLERLKTAPLSELEAMIVPAPAPGTVKVKLKGGK